jgi:hypothetical protein
MPPNRCLVIAAVVAVCACNADNSSDSSTVSSTPESLTGRWVREHADGSWGDTLQLFGDGSVGGSSTNPVPQNARWWVRRSAIGVPLLCMSDAQARSCESYRLAGDTLISGGGPGGPTKYRRVP